MSIGVDSKVLDSTAKPHTCLPRYCVARVDTYMEAHLGENISVDTLASIVDLSTHHFIRAYKQTTGTTPYKHLIAKRVERACVLIESSSHPLAEIALIVGFCSQAHMSEAFRRLHQIPPGAYRKQTHRQDSKQAHKDSS